MIHSYEITGITCAGCVNKVKSKLLSVPEIEGVEVDQTAGVVSVSMAKHLTLSALQTALGGKDSKYQLVEEHHNELVEQTKSFFTTYKPVILLFGYVGVSSLIASWQGNSIDWQLFMRIFMAGFFLSFSFFKLLNLNAFAESYAMYDIVAKKFKSWGYVYAFVELALGLAFLTNFNPMLTNAVTLVVMSLSIVGVVQSVLNRKKIQCACLGAVFNLPMSTLTIIEDLVMILMSGAMLTLM